MEAWKPIRPQGFQNEAPRPPKWSFWVSKTGPGWGPGSPKWLQVGPESIRMVVWRSLGTPREPSRPLGSGLGGPRAAKMGAKGTQDTPKAPKMVPKWGQNGVQNRSKMGSDSEYPKMSISDRCLNDFLSKMEQNLFKFWKEFVLGLTFVKHHKSFKNVIRITLLKV